MAASLAYLLVDLENTVQLAQQASLTVDLPRGREAIQDQRWQGYDL